MKKFMSLFLTVCTCLFIGIMFTACNEESDHEHLWSEWNTLENASCIQEGKQERSCSCGEKETKTISKVSHTEVTDVGVSATCENAGLTEGSHCLVCNEVIVAQTVIDALGHNSDGIITHKDATCTEAGVVGGTYCTRCQNGKSSAEASIIALGHNNDGVVAHKDATCTEAGVVGGTYCTRCQNGKSSAEAPIIALGHNNDGVVAHKDATCTEAGVVGGNYCTRCQNGKSSAEAPIIALGHNSDDLVPPKDATCTETGLTEGKKCSVCGEITVKQETVPIKHKNEQIIPGKASTCMETGLTDGKKCTDCGTVIWEQEIIVRAHTYENDVCSVCGEHRPSWGLKFTLNEDMLSYSVSQGTCTDTLVYLPSLYNGLPVTHISESGFWGCGMTDIVIPHSITAIGDYAFYECTGLAGVYITDLSAWCTMSHSGTYTNPLQYANALYVGGDLLTELTIPERVTDIAAYSFYKYDSLTKVIIHGSVQSIGVGAFKGCDGLTSIEIPSSVNSIGNAAFSACSALESIVIQNGVTSIGAWAFEHCSKLTSIEIPSSVISIGLEAFSYCTNLKSATIKNGGTSQNMFRECTNLTSVTVENGVIGSSAFFKCTNLTSLILNGVSEIGDYAFQYCTSLKNISIPSSVTSIGENAFYGCSSLATAIIPQSVVNIGGFAFDNCNMVTVYCEAPNKPDEWNTRWNDTRPIVWGYSYVMKDGVMYGIKDDSATVIVQPYQSENLIISPSVTLNGVEYDVTGIADYVFELWYSLKTVEIPDSMINIGKGAFTDCINLEKIIIPESVTKIGNYAFSYCEKLTIYCEAKEEPETWDAKWNYSKCPVVWGYVSE